MRRGFWEHFLTFCIGSLLTIIAVKAAYMERGYIALGGEWLTLPIVFMIKTLIVQHKNISFRQQTGFKIQHNKPD